MYIYCSSVYVLRHLYFTNPTHTGTESTIAHAHTHTHTHTHTHSGCVAQGAATTMCDVCVCVTLEGDMCPGVCVQTALTGFRARASVVVCVCVCICVCVCVCKPLVHVLLIQSIHRRQVIVSTCTKVCHPHTTSTKV